MSHYKFVVALSLIAAPAFAETVLYVLPNNLGYIREDRQDGRVVSSTVNLGSASSGGSMSVRMSGVNIGNGSSSIQNISSGDGNQSVSIINNQVIINGKPVQKDKLKQSKFTAQDEAQIHAAKSRRAACAQKRSMQYANAVGDGNEGVELDLSSCDNDLDAAQDKVIQVALKRATAPGQSGASTVTKAATTPVPSPSTCSADVVAARKAVTNFKQKGYPDALFSNKWAAWTNATPKKALNSEVKATEESIRKAFHIANPALVRQILLSRPLDFAVADMRWPNQEVAWHWFTYLYNQNRSAAGAQPLSDEKIKNEVARVIAEAKPCWNILNPSQAPALSDFNKSSNSAPEHRH